MPGTRWFQRLLDQRKMVGASRDKARAAGHCKAVLAYHPPRLLRFNASFKSLSDQYLVRAFEAGKERWRVVGGGLCRVTFLLCQAAKTLCRLRQRFCKGAERHCKLLLSQCKSAKRLCRLSLGHCKSAARFCQLILSLGKCAEWLCGLSLWRCQGAAGHCQLILWHCRGAERPFGLGLRDGRGDFASGEKDRGSRGFLGFPRPRGGGHFQRMGEGSRVLGGSGWP